MKEIQIICDSLADIPKELVEKYNIKIIPLTIRINEVDYKDGVDISNAEFYEKLKESDEMPKTSQATYIQFEEVFRKYTDEGKSILYISGSSKVTGTYQSALMAKNDIEGDITVFDSLNLSYGCGVQVVKACELAKEGYLVNEIISRLESLRENVYILFAVDTLDYLKKGGRISATKATVGTVLNIKPLMEVSNGKIHNIAQVRGRKKVIDKIIELVKLNCEGDLSNRTIAIGDGDNMLELEKLKEALQKEFVINHMTKIEIGPSIGSHTGPGTIGICVY